MTSETVKNPTPLNMKGIYRVAQWPLAWHLSCDERKEAVSNKSALSCLERLHHFHPLCC